MNDKAKRVGFIGLGIMGSRMAVNLVRAGFDVTGFSRRMASVDTLVAAGGKWAPGVAEATEEMDIVITMLPDSPDVEAVAYGDDGILARAKPGLVYIDMSTVRPQTAIELAAAGRSHGVRVLDAPVSGGESGAADATLSIMVGGGRDAFVAATPVLNALGETIVHVGPPGAGQTVKAANQLIVAGTISLVSEALVLLEAAEVPADAAIEVLRGGLAGNRILDLKAAKMLARDFAPGFRTDLHYKDLGIVLATARELGVALPVSAIVSQLMGALRARGGGSLDHTALLTVVEELSGRSAAGMTTARRDEDAEVGVGVNFGEGGPSL
jgi:2-hydroxy-3-oxopropionate reductase